MSDRLRIENAALGPNKSVTTPTTGSQNMCIGPPDILNTIGLRIGDVVELHGSHLMTPDDNGYVLAVFHDFGEVREYYVIGTRKIHCSNRAKLVTHCLDFYECKRNITSDKVHLALAGNVKLVSNAVGEPCTT